VRCCAADLPARRGARRLRAAAGRRTGGGRLFVLAAGWLVLASVSVFRHGSPMQNERRAALEVRLNVDPFAPLPGRGHIGAADPGDQGAFRPPLCGQRTGEAHATGTESWLGLGARRPWRCAAAARSFGTWLAAPAPAPVAKRSAPGPDYACGAHGRPFFLSTAPLALRWRSAWCSVMHGAVPGMICPGSGSAQRRLFPSGSGIRSAQAGLLLILESLGADSVRCACCRLGCSACAELDVFCIALRRVRVGWRVSSWHICIKNNDLTICQDPDESSRS